MKAHWKIFVEAKTEQKTEKVIQQLFNRLFLDQKSAPIIKADLLPPCTSSLPVADWPEAVVTTLQKAQRVGRSWILTGDITEGLDAWSNDALISGISNLEVLLKRP